jgi:D-beta-D-heptose 7-phosphate kinase/D-beta-D-heptose 1-phosphate adenosyltransferase
MQIINKFLNLIRSHGETKPRLQIGVVGDAMVDEYYKVDINRISPEYPIPIYNLESDTPLYATPGGAGNLCLQFVHFPVDVSLMSLLDVMTADMYRGFRINVANSVGVFGPIPTKKRYYQGNHPVLRLDIEQADYGSPRIAENRADLNKKVQDATQDILLYSDYGKGVFADFPSYIPEGKTVIVDPKKGPINKWRGATIIKPNAKEARELTGTSCVEKQCDIFIGETNCRAVLITQGSEGVVGRIDGQPFEYRLKSNTFVKSPIGAGDCYLAFLSMAIGVGMSIAEAAELACEASRVFVSHRTPNRLHNDPVAIDQLVPLSRNKIGVLPSLGKWVFCNGCFDNLHAGHVSLLNRAKALGDKLIVAVNSDESVTRIKGSNRPIIPLNDRMEMLAALECVDSVLSFEEDVPLELIKSLNIDILVKGMDWEGKEIIGREFVKEVVLLPIHKNISTTKIEEKIKNSE